MKKAAKMAAVLVAAMLFGSSFMTEATVVYATSQTQEKPESEMTEAEKAAKEAKEAREKLIQKTYELPVQTNELTGWPEGPGTYGEAAIVMDADSGAILFAKNIDKTEYPASITKVLTALLAYESGIDMDEMITVSEESLGCLGGGYSSIGLKAGNEITLEHALHAMLMASANEASYVIGENVAKLQGHDYDWFLQRMNERCEELGGTNSNFVNTNGVFDEAHVTCARDMALIGCALFDYPGFFDVCQTQQYTIPETESVEEHVFQQHHRMLLDGDKYYYENAVGGKTGYTTEAENTLITMAQNGDKRLVCVALKTYEGHLYEDSRAMLDYAFANFGKVSIKENDDCDGFTLKDASATVTLPDGVSFDELDREIEERDDGAAILSYYYEENLVGSTEVSLDEGFSGFKSRSDRNGGDDASAGADEGDSLLKKMGIILAGVLGVSMILSYLILRAERARRNRRRRRRRGRRRRRR